MLVYHYLPAQYGLEDIQRRELKVARLDNLNDPHEFACFQHSTKLARDLFGRTVAGLATKCGVLCFSATWRSPVMWAHYADRHRGLCLGFEVADELIMPVTYVEERAPFDPEKHMKDGRNDEGFACRVLSTKSHHWAYEQEHRVFVQLDPQTERAGHYFRPFAPVMQLRRVIVGEVSDVKRAELYEVLGSLRSKVECFKARRAFTTYEMTEQKMRSRWK